VGERGRDLEGAQEGPRRIVTSESISFDDPPTNAPTTRAVLLVDLETFTPGYDLQLTAALETEGWTVELIMSEYEFEEVVPRAASRPSVRRRLRGLPRSLKAIPYLVDLIRLDRRLARLAPSIVHIQWAHLPWVDRILWGRWRRSGWTVVYTAHDPRPLDGTTPRVLARSYSTLPACADAVVVHSEFARSVLIDAGTRPERVHMIPPASPFKPVAGAPTRSTARQALGLSTDDRVVLFFGFLKPYKGLAVLLRSLAQLKRSGVSARLLIAGEVLGPTADYDRLISELDLSRDVDWRPGFVPSSEVATLFAAADVIGLPYLDASSSGVLLSAYACRRPVVVSAVGGLPELVVPGETGVIVPPNDPAALAAALSELLLDLPAGERMGENAFELSQERFTWPGMGRRLGALYDELLLQPPGSP
jgi:glycosyltransferase involved in cell wall biosynthesis